MVKRGYGHHARIMAAPSYLYRHYDLDGRLLYVGIARRPKRRRYQHSSESPWGKCIASSRYVEYPTKEAALAAEAEAIAYERPIYNKKRPARPLGLDASKVPCPLLRDLFLRKEPVQAPAPRVYAYTLPLVTFADLQDQWRLMAQAESGSYRAG